MSCQSCNSLSKLGAEVNGDGGGVEILTKWINSDQHKVPVNQVKGGHYFGDEELHSIWWWCVGLLRTANQKAWLFCFSF